MKAPKAKLYLAGHGGSVESTLQLINTMHASKTEIEVIVYGDVYSAHAMLAVTAKKLTVLNDNILFLFHVAAVNVNGTFKTMLKSCEDTDERETDRGVSARQKCIEYANAAEKEFAAIISTSIQKYLTKEQYQKMLDGHDVILPYGEIKWQ